MRLTSSAFVEGGAIPSTFTCEGADVSPPHAWSDVPAGTRCLALVVDDPDAPDPAAPTTTWVHWVVFDLPPEPATLPEDVGGRMLGQVGVNDWGRTRWGGPCPPRGRHRYQFKLYALDRLLGLSRPSRADVERAMEGHVLAATTLVGTYEKRATVTRPRARQGGAPSGSR